MEKRKYKVDTLKILETQEYMTDLIKEEFFEKLKEIHDLTSIKFG